MTPSVESIRKHGDPLERLFFRDEAFATAFPLYAEVWSKAVLPFRLEGAAHLASPEHEPFASSHYSAIVRCWSVYQTRLRITNISADCVDAAGASEILALHDALFSYFCLAGAAIDNLEKCFKAKPDRGDAGAIGSLEWFYDRRTRMVHQLIVPVWSCQGLPQLSPDTLGKGATWSSAGATENSVTPCSVVEQTWPLFICKMNGWWSALLTELANQPSPNAPGVYSPIAITHAIAPSGSPPSDTQHFGGIE